MTVIMGGHEEEEGRGRQTSFEGSTNPNDISEQPSDQVNVALLPCAICARTFFPSALERHRKICEKLSSKQKSNSRQTFDTIKKRHEGLDLPPQVSFKGQSKNKGREKSKSRWREKHEEFLRAIRAAKETTEEESGTPAAIVPSDYVQCPHCERHFGPKAADRHIDWCAEQKNRMPRGPGDEAAMQRLKTRTKYIPPRPGEGGWRAPKKRDVISSIPPPSTVAAVTPQGRLISPPLPSSRHVTPPPAPLPTSRKSSTGTAFPPNPFRYGTGSLGRAAGRQFSAMLQAMTGSSGGNQYGPSTAGQRSHYGQNRRSKTPDGPFVRTGSLRSPIRRPLGSSKMARHRDLTLDMMASVNIAGASTKRGEPEGIEAVTLKRDFESFSSKFDDAHYDPFSAAELQFQDLLGSPTGSRRSSGLGLGLMGSTGSLQNVGLSRISLERDFLPSPPSRLRGYSLCSLGTELDDSSPDIELPKKTFESYAFQSQEKNSDNSSPDREYGRTRFSDYGFRYEEKYKPVSPDDKSLENIDMLVRECQSESPRGSSALKISEYIPRSSEERSSSMSDRSRSVSRTRSLGHAEGNTSCTFRDRKPDIQRLSAERSLSSRSPTPFSDAMNLSPVMRKSPQREWGSPTHRPHSPSSPFLRRWGMESALKPGASTQCQSSVGTSPQSYSRHFATLSKERDAAKECSQTGSYKTAINEEAYSSAFESLKSLRAIIDDGRSPSRSCLRLDDATQRTSSASSAGSPLPPVLSPTSDFSSQGAKTSSPSSLTSLPKFCHECGHKYPVTLAKFCCQCGSRRVSLEA